MGRKTSDDLFVLIKSLDVNEKRYFKKYFTRKGFVLGENYLSLFDYLQKLGNYDEIKIKEHFKDKIFSKQLHRTKNYLYNLVLKSLRSYHENKSIENKLYTTFLNIEILYNRNLKKQCAKLTSAVMKLALDNQLYKDALIALHWEQKLLVDNLDAKSSRKILFKSIESEVNVLEILNESLLYTQAGLEIIVLDRNLGNDNNDSIKLSYEKILTKYNFLKKNPPKKSFEAIYWYNLFYAVYYLAKHDLNKSLIYFTSIHDTFQKTPKILLRQQHRYITNLRNLINIQIALKMNKQSKQSINILSSIIVKQHQSVGYMYLVLSMMKLYHSVVFIEIDAGLSLANQILKNLNNYKEYGYSDYINILYLSAKVYFLNEKFEAAHQTLLMFLDNKVKHSLFDLYISARLFEIILHYELNNVILAESLVKSMKKFLKENGKLQGFELNVLNCISELLNVYNNDKEKKSVLKKYKNKLNEYQSGFMSDRFIPYFIPYWFDCKIKGCSFKSILEDNKNKIIGK